MEPLHEVRDKEKLERLVESLEEKGWEGVPLVIWPVYNQLLTGSHRYAAAKELEWADSEIPVIDIEEIFVEAGLDFQKVLKKHGYPFYCESGFLKVLWTLPQPIRDKYGIDWH